MLEMLYQLYVKSTLYVERGALEGRWHLNLALKVLMHDQPVDVANPAVCLQTCYQPGLVALEFLAVRRLQCLSRTSPETWT